MAADGCIHPSCACKAYKDPGHPKGTLLLLRLGCKQCGHHGSEHRKLTAVDNLIREEVEKAASNKCTHLIPVSEIPHSPVFGPHDPIPIPYESTKHNQDNSVRCTCTGFKVPSLVKLWQSFRTHSMSGAIAALPKVTCSTCQHFLQSHQLEAPNHPQTQSSSLEIGSIDAGTDSLDYQHPQLTLKASAKLALTPVNSCVQLLPAVGGSGNLTLVSLHATESGLSVAVCSGSLAPSAQNGSKEMQMDAQQAIADAPESMQNDPSLPESSAEASDVVDGTKLAQKSAPKRGRKRKRLNPPLQARRKSARLQEQQKKGEALAESMKQAREQRARESELARRERERLCGCMVNFVSSLEKRESYTTYPLPEAISKCTIEDMAVAVAGGGGSLVLALSAAGGELFIVAPAAEVTWTAVGNELSGKSVKSLAWLVKPTGLYLCAGGRDGSVAVRSVRINSGSAKIEYSLVARRQDTPAQITLSTWAPDERLLALGTQMGEVLLYTFSPEASPPLQLVQRLQCCGSTVTCASWMENGSMLAVGGTDDSVQVLQKKHSPSSCPTPPQYSLLTHFKPVDSDKFIHTHWLRGHQSFVASLLSPGPGRLLSIGWDGQILFWHGIEPIRHRTGDCFPFEDSEPHCGFKLGPSTSSDFLPLALSDALGFGTFVLLTDRSGDKHLVYYTFLPISVS